MPWRRAALLAFGATLLLAACDQKPRRAQRGTKKARSPDEKPWWHDMYEEQKKKARQRTIRLIETSKTYPRPPADPNIYWTGKGNKIAMVDRKTGDYLLCDGWDHENLIMTLSYMTKDDQLVCWFNTQWGGGYGMEWERYPIRVFGVGEAKHQTDAVRAARKRITLERLAEFMAAFPDYARNPEKDFVIFDAPREPGERLEK